MKSYLDRKQVKQRKFTLLELLVVIAIIIILAAMLLPVFSNVRARGKMTSCRNNLSQIGLSQIMYRGDYDDSMPGWLSNLVPDYGVEAKLLVCPQDYSEGHDGGRPRRAEDPVNGDKYTAEDYGIDYVSKEDEIFDAYAETDDTDRNTESLSESNEIKRNTDITRCSYMYEFAGTVCDWKYWGGSFLVELKDASEPEPGWTWNQVKASQLRSGSYNGLEGSKAIRTFQFHLFPSVRCFYHWGTMWGKTEYILNTSYEGSTFPSKAEWELGVYEGQ